MSDSVERVRELQVALRRSIALIERLLLYVMWDGLDAEYEDEKAYATLRLIKEALGE